VLIGVGLWLIGIPSGVLWGILAAVLRFVPYVGPIIAAGFPLALAVAVDPGWSMLAWTAVLFFVVEPIVGQVVEPMVYGRSTGLSPVAVVVSATFWTAL
jgi:predicted PurR-regulated permease PerM